MKEKLKYFIFNKSSDYERGLCDSMDYGDDGLRVSEKAGGDRGRFMSRVLDSFGDGTEWHRLFVNISPEAAGDCRITVYASDTPDIEAEGRIMSLGEVLKAPDKSFDEKLKIFRPYQRLTVSGKRDILLHGISGRYLWILTELYSRGDVEAHISDMTVYLPAGTWMDYLPQVYANHDREERFLERYLAIFQTLYEDLNRSIDSSANNFDYACTGREFLSWLAEWLDIADSYVWPEDRLRKFLGCAVSLYKRRGTRGSLEEIVSIYTGERPYIVEQFELKKFRDGNRYREVLVPMYGEDSFTVTLLVKEKFVRTRRDFNILLKIAEEMKPAQMELRLVPLKPYIFLDSFSFLGINSELGQYRSAALDGASPITLTAISKSEDGQEAIS